MVYGHNFLLYQDAEFVKILMCQLQIPLKYKYKKLECILSFIAQDGDGKSYSIRPYVNGIEYGSGGTGMQIKFYQQPTTQKYEVSTHGLFALAKDDTIEWRIYVATASATAFYINTLKMNLVNLQQIGLH